LFSRSRCLSLWSMLSPVSKSLKQAWHTFLVFEHTEQISVLLNRLLAPGRHLNTLKGRSHTLQALSKEVFIILMYLSLPKHSEHKRGKLDSSQVCLFISERIDKPLSPIILNINVINTRYFTFGNLKYV